MLEYIPAPRAGIRAEESCFTPRRSAPESEPTLALENVIFPESSTMPVEDGWLSNAMAARSAAQMDVGGAVPAVAFTPALPYGDGLLATAPLTARMSAGLAAVEPLGSPIETLQAAQHLTDGTMLEANRRGADQILQQLLPPSLGDAAELFMTWGSYLPLHGDAVLAVSRSPDAEIGLHRFPTAGYWLSQ